MSRKRPHNLLVVEDEAHILAGLEINLSMEGYRVRCAKTLREAHRAMDDGDIDLVVLDLMLPDGYGMDFCRSLRRHNDFTPIIILTAKGSQKDVVEGLDGGADDYLSKPFDLDELLSRVRVLLRRLDWESRRDDGRAPTVVGAGVVDWEAHELVCKGQVRRLTGLEVRLLSYFVEHAGQTLTREDLLRDVWGLTGYQTRTVDNFVARMRKYFEEDPSEPTHFLTVRGTGYRFEP